MSDVIREKGQILVVDDEAALLELFAEVLRNHGYTVQTALNGRQALELLRALPFDAVISDIRMPDMDGLALLRAVRARDLDCPVLLMTGNPEMDTAIQALEHGAMRYLLKPVSAETMIEAVGVAVRLHQLARLKREALEHSGANDRLLGDRASLEAAFGRALDSLWIAYQPIFEATSGLLYAREALARTQEPALMLPSPLFDAAERLGRTNDVGRIVRERVAAFLNGSSSGEGAFVNIHPTDLLDEALYVPTASLSKHAASVVIEVTERASLEHLPDVRGRVRALRQLGFRIAIDDVGAGYAGLTSFVALEPDIVKIDMALVRGVDHEPIKRRLIGSMVSVCQSMDILVVAEGVETEAEQRVLVDLGCDLLQGFLLGLPAVAPTA